MRIKYSGFLVFMALVFGCHGETPKSSAPADLGTASPGMPQLKRLLLALPPELLPAFARAPIAVSDAGKVVFAIGASHAEMLLTAIDSTGRLISQFARRGAGPNEMRSVGFVAFVGDTLMAIDNEQARLIAFDERLHPISMRSIRFGSRVLSAGGRGVIAFLPREAGGPRLELTSLGGEAASEPLLAGADTVIARLISSRGQFGRDGPPFGVVRDRLILGDPMDYELVFYGASGDEFARLSRSMPNRTRTPAELGRDSARLRSALRFRGPDGRITEIAGVRERLDGLSSEVLPHFDSHGIKTDRRGRIWVIGNLRDSTFIDVWRDTTLLGRHMVNCADPGSSVSPNGSYLALICRTEDENAAANVELQLYKVEESPGL
jgi:hypothetical protein